MVAIELPSVPPPDLEDYAQPRRIDGRPTRGHLYSDATHGWSPRATRPRELPRVLSSRKSPTMADPSWCATTADFTC
jgi:hypothetical protein